MLLNIFFWISLEFKHVNWTMLSVSGLNWLHGSFVVIVPGTKETTDKTDFAIFNMKYVQKTMSVEFPTQLLS